MSFKIVDIVGENLIVFLNLLMVSGAHGFRVHTLIFTNIYRINRFIDLPKIIIK